jgi:HlyD family secretion protein
MDISQSDFARLKMSQKQKSFPTRFQFALFIAEIAPEANRAKATVQIKVKVDNPNEQSKLK